MAKSGQAKGRSGIPAALGFRSHSGWTAMVAVGGPASARVILDRQRIELIAGKIPRQPYHASEGLELSKAEKIIAHSLETATRLAGKAIETIVDDLQQRGYKVVACGLLLASGRSLPELAKILASHALIHTAEGELFRDAIATASKSQQLNMFRVKEKELPASAAAQLAMSWEEVQQELKELGRPLGSPWGQDQKYAALAAWLALKGEKQQLH